MEKKLIKKVILKKEIEVITGMHIGAGSDNVEIGGVDKPVIRRTIDNVPYIPGSSLKGKIRSILEQIAGSADIGGNKEINQLFGFAPDISSKLIVRDATMTDESIELLKKSDHTDMPYTEIKYENSIIRTSGKAVNPRQIERVPAGAKFNVELVINVWGISENDNDEKLSIKLLENGIKALENDYIGGNGSRGYGKIVFKDIDRIDIPFTNFINNES